MRIVISICGIWLFAQAGLAQESLHQQIDALIQAKAKGQTFSGSADDAEYLRRVYLDFAGRIPSATEARRFLDSKEVDRRTKLLDALLAGPEYAASMEGHFHVMLMERLGDHADWKKYLQRSFADNKPWDELVREILAAGPQEKAPGAAFFLSKRLENYGANPVDYPALTRDIGRLFLGKDFRCAQCHDHLTIKDYKQHDFQGLFVFVKNVSLSTAKTTTPGVTEKPTTAKIEFSSVFGGDKVQTGPRVPGLKEIAIPTLKKGEEYVEKPDVKQQKPGVLKFSTLAALSEQLPTPANQAFNRNIVNRLWFVLMGRGLVHPLDLDHGDNPPSHPEVLDLLAKEFVAHKYDIKWLVRELALTQTYQRSSQLPPLVKNAKPEEFRTALERRMSAEQLLRSMLQATGMTEVKAAKGVPTFDTMSPTFVKAFASEPREPEEEFSPTLKATLFLLNDKSVLSWLEAQPGNLLDRLGREIDNRKAVEELYLSVLTRLPGIDEAADAVRYLDERKGRRPVALRNLAWALFASTEFCVNH